MLTFSPISFSASVLVASNVQVIVCGKVSVPGTLAATSWRLPLSLSFGTKMPSPDVVHSTASAEPAKLPFAVGYVWGLYAIARLVLASTGPEPPSPRRRLWLGLGVALGLGMSVRVGGAILIAYLVLLLGLVALKVLTPGFYAKQDIRTPVKVAVVVLLLTQGLNLLFVPRLGHAGLALAIGCGALVNALWLLIALRRRGSWHPAPGWRGFGLKVGFASALMGIGLAWAARSFDWIALGHTEGLRAGMLAAVLAGAALLYFGTLCALGLRPRDFARRA